MLRLGFCVTWGVANVNRKVGTVRWQVASVTWKVVNVKPEVANVTCKMANVEQFEGSFDGFDMDLTCVIG